MVADDEQVQNIGSGVRVGERLRQAREAAGLALEAIAQQTRVPVRHLIAIEKGDDASLPALTYSTGFVKAFANAVGLNPHELSQQFRGETDAHSSNIAHYHYEPVDPARVPPKRLAWIAAALALVLVAAFALLHERNIASPSAEVEAAAAPESTVPDALPPPPAAPAPTVTPSSPTTITATGPVEIIATEEVWLKVYGADGRAVKMGTLQQGESYIVPADQPDLKLWTGKAGALAVKVGGQAIAPLGGITETVRDVSLTPASLLARGSPTPAP